MRLWPGAIDVEEIEDAVELTGGQDGERIHTAALEAGASASGAAAVDSGSDLAGLGHTCGGAETAGTWFISVLGGDGKVLGRRIRRLKMSAGECDMSRGTGVPERRLGAEERRFRPEEQVTELMSRYVWQVEA